MLIPAASGVLSALGLAAADLRRDYVAPAGASFAELEERAARDVPGAGIARLVDARYLGQSHELTVDAADWEAGFGDEHERRYGFRLDGEPELVNLRVVATVPRPPPTLRTAPGPGREGRRRAYLDGEWLELPVLGPGAAVSGPSIVELPGATCLVRSGWAGKPDAADTLVLERTWTR